MDDGTYLVAAEQVVLIGAQMQSDIRAARRLIQHLYEKFPAAIRFPAHALVGLLPGAARGDNDLVGDDKSGIETDAELPDQVRILLLKLESCLWVFRKI